MKKGLKLLIIIGKVFSIIILSLGCLGFAVFIILICYENATHNNPYAKYMLEIILIPISFIFLGSFGLEETSKILKKQKVIKLQKNGT